MLKTLYIENIAVIEKCSIDFGGGLNVLTGETGAGKSIIIDAINAIMGQRTSKDMIRTGAASAFVSICFENINGVIRQKLSDLGFDDADGELAIEAVLSLGVYGVAEENAWVLSDAYDSEGSFSCETKSVPCLNYVGERTRTTVLREPVYLPGHMKDVTRVLYVTATPAVTDTVISERDASIDGLLLLSIVYRADDGRLYGFRTDLPFSLPLEPFGTLLLPSVTVRSAQAAGSGRTLSCTVDLKYGGEWYRQETALFTTDLRPGVPRDPHEGILVYFPDRGETVFSIGKRFGVPTSVIRAQNPTLSEPIPDGAHVLLLRK